MRVNWTQLLLGFLLAGGLSIAAYHFKLLTTSGALAAWLLGSVVFGLGGIPWTAILLTFFISSNFLSRIFSRRKASLEKEYAKGSRRDGVQVIANGGIAGILVILSLFVQDKSLLWVAYCAAFAAANADTWATELGVLSRAQPRLITTWKSVLKGTSGGISLAGVLASLAGAGLVALVGLLFFNNIGIDNGKVLPVFITILLSGFFGSIVDSFIGAGAQAVYWCPRCEKETERHLLHHCGEQTRFLRGWRWMNNDLVNFICTASAVFLAVMLFQFWIK